jgi:hypothetical protein
MCGCGLPFRSCPFWQEVVAVGFGGFHAAHPDEVAQAKRSVDSFVNIPRILTGGWTKRYRAHFARYQEALALLYRAIHKVSGASVIVDASKDPQHAYILRSIPGFDVRVLHLLRDSRAVAFSWQRRRRRPEVIGPPQNMPRYPVVRTALAWSLTNLGAEFSRRLGVPYVFVRYEDLVRDTRGELGRVFQALDLGVPDLSFIRPAAARLEPSHTVSGNPMRFQSGEVPIRQDDEWRSEMSRPRRALVGAITSPLLLHYGYRMDGTLRSQPRLMRAERSHDRS